MCKIVIIGGKGTAVNIAECIVGANEKYGAKDEFIGYCIDDLSLGDAINGYPILCNLSALGANFNDIDDVRYLFALYKPAEMRKRVELLSVLGLPMSKFTNFIHPSCTVLKSSNMGVGNAFLPGCMLSNNSRIGNFNILNTHCIIEHDTVLGNNNFLADQTIIGSHVRVADGNFFGMHSAVLEDTNIGCYNFIGMGGVLLRSIGDNKIMVGLPAKELNK